MVQRCLLTVVFDLPRNICWKKGKAGCCRPSVPGRAPAAAQPVNAPPHPLSDGPSLGRLPRLPRRQISPGTRLQPMISVRMKKTKFLFLLSSPLLSVPSPSEALCWIPHCDTNTKPKDSCKEKTVGAERGPGNGGSKAACLPGSICHPSREGGWLYLRSLFYIHIPSLRTLLYCLCSCDLDREIVIFINFLKD